ncbi:MAG TPA: DUF5060 domain-containing protein [Candidatus Hydrogenedentes bacterium]|nr:DUF5060 domain-containing protein [Candidatus Hydrogenedentota bacterium]HOL76293.1 DUF5060 domain-containing protein [Candidatus Hydrogenedentota bacterium]HPO86120.1 DUF5060 domain-containing protein [Candidatus Hydrogenedentota bacterium]
MCRLGVLFGMFLQVSFVVHAGLHFPAEEWESREPERMKMDAAKLDEIAALLEGRGCIIKDGYIVKAWGDQKQRGDWFSAAKPVLSTLLFFAIEEGLVKSVDEPIADFGWELKEKDRGITFRHLGSMNSGYARPEGPGEAWAYNDFAIQLYQKTLFDCVFRQDPQQAAEAPNRLGALGLQDGLKFDPVRRRMSASVRDFARIAWFWASKGRWGHRQVLPRHYFDDYMQPQTHKNLPQTQPADTDDYLGIGSYGGGSDHFSKAGPGIYGFNWWFNSTGRLHPDLPTWPDAPADTVMAIGAGGNCAAIMPSLGVALVCAKGKWGELCGGDRTTRMNQVLGLLARACGYSNHDIVMTGEARVNFPLTLSMFGPPCSESGDPNPFTDYKFSVTFWHGRREVVVPGYFAADGIAGNSGADSGNVWRAHFVPDEAGEWKYRVSFVSGKDVAIAGQETTGTPAAPDGTEGVIRVAKADLAAPGFYGKGMLNYVGKHYLQFAGSREYFIKGGADSPENFLAFVDFDQTPPSHHYEPHAGDWRWGDPLWGDNKGKNIIGALNYLAGQGMNSVYFLTMNVKGDGKDVWMWTSDTERQRFDCSKLDQWEVVFRHMDRLGLMLHVITQEQENDQLFDKGALGPQRRLYYRELVARFAHHLGVVWNLGEENTNTDEERKAFAEYIRALDPYDHSIVVHTFPNQYDKVYTPLLGYPYLEGPSLQMGDKTKTYAETLKWVRRSNEAGKPWIVCLDEIGPANIGVKPDTEDPDHDEVRRYCLWGNLMAGGAGVEWYFGYDYPNSDLTCEDWRSRENMWAQTRYALEFFHQYLPFWDMVPLENGVRGDGVWCLASPPKTYLLYMPQVGGVALHLPKGRYVLQWFNPRAGGGLIEGGAVKGGDWVPIGSPPADADRDWVLLVRRQSW